MTGIADPPVFRPMLAGAVGIPTDGAERLVEPKLDGVRAIVTIHAGTLRLTSRNGNDVTAGYPELQPPPPIEAVLDGEIVAAGPDGRPSFGVLQRRMHVRRPSAALVAKVPVNLVVFDVLWLDGTDLTDEPQRRRRAILETLPLAPPWARSLVLDFPVDSGLLETGRDLGLEGFVLKRADAPYRPGVRSEAWCKVKCVRRREFVVGGWMEGQRSRKGSLGSLALGVWAGDPRRLVYMGMAGSGLTHKDLAAFEAALPSLERAGSPFANATPRGVRYLEPVLVAEVTFSEVTADGVLRHPVLEGFRTDKEADEVVWDDELA